MKRIDRTVLNDTVGEFSGPPVVCVHRTNACHSRESGNPSIVLDARFWVTLTIVLLMTLSLLISSCTSKDSATSEPPAPTAPPAPPPTAPPANPTLGDAWTRPADGMTMLYVPAGQFQMGSDDAQLEEAVRLCEAYGGCGAGLFVHEQPPHSVTLDGFWIDQTEVSNAQFAAFLNQRGHQTEGGVPWLELADERCLIEEVDGQFQPKPGYAEHPVLKLSWHGAAAYCQWAGARLPTEAEWEYAARGEAGSVYPWGDQFDPARLNFCDANCDYDWSQAERDDGYERTAPVGSFPAGASWCGALDLAGNVWEWTGDWYDAEYYEQSPEQNPSGPEGGEARVLRGGAWFDAALFMRGAYRAWDEPDNRSTVTGFRCVKSGGEVGP